MRNHLPPLLLLINALPTKSQCGPCDITTDGWAVRPGTGCTEYINCVAGVEALVNICPGGTVFDQAIVACNWAERVTCPADPECKTTTSTTAAATIDAAATAPAYGGGTVAAATVPAYGGGNETATAESAYDGGNETAVTQAYVPLKFSVYGIPEDADESIVQEEMKGILEMILFELEELEKDSGLKILDISAWRRRKTKGAGENVYIDTILGDRWLQSDEPIEMMYNVAVQSVEGVDFGPVIINAIRDDYDSLVADIRGWTDSEYITTDFGFDVCAYSMIDAGYTDCSSDSAAYGYGGDSSNSTEAASYGWNPVTVESSDNSSSEGGISMTIIIVIALASVLLLCFIISAIMFIGCRKGEDWDPDDFSEDEFLRGKKYRSDSEGNLSGSSTEKSVNEMVVYDEKAADGYPERCYVDEEDHNSSVLPRASAIPVAMTEGGSVRSKSSKTSHRSSQSNSKIRTDASGYQVRSHDGSRSPEGSRGHRGSVSGSSYSRRHKVNQPDPSVYNVRSDMRDPSVYNRTGAADPSVYNPNASDPEARSVYSRDLFSRQLESLESNSIRGSKRTGTKSSVRMDYSVVSELSEPSVTDRFA